MQQEADEAERKIEHAIAEHASDVADALSVVETAVSQREEAIAAFDMSRRQARAQVTATDAVIEQLLEEKLQASALLKKQNKEAANGKRQLSKAVSEADAARARLIETSMEAAALEVAA